MKYTASIILEYRDESEVTFEVTIEGTENEIVGLLLMITRGTLQTSMAHKATCYKDDGFELCSFIK